MQKTKLFVTASAVCFALAGAAISGHQSESSSILYLAGVGMQTGECVQATETIEDNCAITNTGGQCTVWIVDSSGIGQQGRAYISPVLGNLCLLALKRPGGL